MVATRCYLELLIIGWTELPGLRLFQFYVNPKQDLVARPVSISFPNGRPGFRKQMGEQTMLGQTQNGNV